MDPVTTALLIRGAVQLGTAAYQQYQGSQQKKEADLSAQRFGAQQRAITESDEVSDVQVSKFPAELARQGIGQQFATTVAAFQGAGAAGVIGGIPSLANIGADKMLDIAAQQARRETERDYFVAQNLQQRARREAIAQRGLLGQQLTGAQMASLEARRRQQQAGISTIQAIGSATAGIIENQPLYPRQEQPTRESEYYQYQTPEMPEAVILPKIDDTQFMEVNQENTNFSGDMYSGLGLDRSQLITF